ncbi:pentatricopeptide repeat-containing protein, mitochondrial [Cinnamomum micranthum f. kanehirae]|uniref:Pentatricopeptide repeat-containing protein, mitochondrial n=1 Tax=Cinnamomum micranthum f. kanehirae TaxID=337451 RepID=A0A443PSN6_9MAGN|nr:pentatricopeptide repeat-containing protein, mitochondrial [Cinnamomum micranthum f. kanehirae]
MLTMVAVRNEAVRRPTKQYHLLLYHQMKQSGVQPNNITFPFLAKACAQLSNLQNSEIIPTHVLKSPFSSDIFVQTAMVVMYVKYCRAFELFHRMRLSELRPDSVTILSLTQLSAIVKNLNVTKAVHCLGIRIGVEIYVSVPITWITVHMLSVVIWMQPSSADEKPDAVTVVPMLAGCSQTGALELGQWMHKYACDSRAHHEVKAAENVANRLFILEPQSAVSYVVMENIYAAAGRWVSVAKIRTKMKCRGVRKSPSRSFVRVNGQFCSFTAEDRSHSEALWIYVVLDVDGLTLQLIEARFKQNSECDLLEEW